RASLSLDAVVRVPPRRPLLPPDPVLRRPLPVAPRFHAGAQRRLALAGRPSPAPGLQPGGAAPLPLARPHLHPRGGDERDGLARVADAGRTPRSNTAVRRRVAVAGFG